MSGVPEKDLHPFIFAIRGVLESETVDGKTPDFVKIQSSFEDKWVKLKTKGLVCFNSAIDYYTNHGVYEKIQYAYGEPVWIFRLQKLKSIELNFEISKVYKQVAVANNSAFAKAWLIQILDEINSGLPDTSQDESVQESYEKVEWTPLFIERESDDFTNAIEEFEKNIQIIAADNGYAANESDERNALIESAKGMIEATKAGNPDKRTFKAVLVDQFKYVSEKFAGTIIGEAAKAIWKLALSLIA